MTLYASVFVSPPIPFTGPSGKAPRPGGLWSPISCTLIHTPSHAVLVDTPITKSQVEALINWIQVTLQKGAELKYIYITHGHGDHWFGVGQLLKKFPGAKAIATSGTIEHMKGQVEPKAFNAMWGPRFPGQIDTDFVFPESLPQASSKKFYLPNGEKEAGYELEALEVGHSDTYSTTVLWVPALRLVVAGDVVYGDVHQMLAEANTHLLRLEWVRAIEKIMALDPVAVVPGHKKPHELDGAWHLENSRQYILDFDRLVESGTIKDARELTREMKMLWPTRFNDGALIMGSMNAFKGKKAPEKKL